MTGELAEATIAQGCAELGIDVGPAQLKCFSEFLALLAHWNRAINLTAIREPDAMIRHHILDSLSVLPSLADRRGPLIDVGTGAGLPGIPLAIMLPGLPVTLIDSNGKKTRFLVEACRRLGLDNVNVVRSRVEDYRPGRCFEVAISRAFASLADFLLACRDILAPGGVLLAMKGRLQHDELAELSGLVAHWRAEELIVPRLDAQRHLIEMTPAGLPGLGEGPP